MVTFWTLQPLALAHRKKTNNTNTKQQPKKKTTPHHLENVNKIQLVWFLHGLQNCGKIDSAAYRRWSNLFPITRTGLPGTIVGISLVQRGLVTIESTSAPIVLLPVIPPGKCSSSAAKIPTGLSHTAISKPIADECTRKICGRKQRWRLLMP